MDANPPLDDVSHDQRRPSTAVRTKRRKFEDSFSFRETPRAVDLAITPTTVRGFPRKSENHWMTVRRYQRIMETSVMIQLGACHTNTPPKPLVGHGAFARCFAAMVSDYRFIATTVATGSWWLIAADS